MKKRWTSILLTLALALSLLPAMTTPARAASVSTWDALASAMNAGGEITLASDVTAGQNSAALTVPYNTTVTLDLAGHTINRNLFNPPLGGYRSDGQVIVVSGGTLILKDSVGGGKITGGASSHSSLGGAGGVYVESGTFQMEGGTITGNDSQTNNGSTTGTSGVYPSLGTTFKMSGGIIEGNNSHEAVYNSSIQPFDDATVVVEYQYAWDNNESSSTISVLNGNLRVKTKRTVALDANGGSVSSASTDITYGDSLDLPTPTRDGYDFDGWFTAASGGRLVKSGTDEKAWGPAWTGTYYAHWTATTRTVTFNNHDGTTLSTETVNDGTAWDAVTKPTASREGYDFAGWTGAPATVTADVTVTASYTPITYTIAYTLNGGSVATANPTSYNIETDAFTLNNPTKNGYTFNGWTGSNGTTPQTSVSISQGNTGDKSYTANWTANTYTVTFDPNGGSVSPTSKNVTFDSAYGTLPTPTRADYDFAGWYTEESGGTQVTSDTTFAITGDQTLYAHWTANVTLVPNGVTVSGTNVDAQNSDGNYILHTKGNAVDLSSLTVTASGGTFNGWFDNEVPMLGTKQTNIAAGAAPMLLAASTTRYITLKDGSTSLGSLLVYVGQPLPGLTSIPTKAGHTFAGYYTEQNGGGTCYYNADGAGQITYDGSTHNATMLYANWTTSTVTVSVSADPTAGGTVYIDSSGTTSKSVTYNATASLSATANTGYTFAGWYLNGALVSSNASYTTDTVTEARAYVARFTKNTYTVTFDPDGGTGGGTFTYSYGDALGTLPGSAKEGYDFDGWYNGGMQATSNTTVTATVTYTAKWTQKTYSIAWPSPANYTLGGSATGTTSVNHGGSVTFTVTPSTGYTGANMVVSANGVALGATGVSGGAYTYEVKNITADQTVTVTGVEKIKFPVTLSNGTGYTVSPTYQEVEYGGTMEFTVTPESGYSSVTVSSATLKSETTNTYQVTNVTAQPNITISATAATIFTVTFRSEGLIYSLVNVESGGAVTLPAGLTRTGYTFGGWSESAGGTTAVSGTSVTASADKTYYAIWTANTYTVSYDDGVDGETISVPNSQTKTYNETLTLSSTVPTRTGYTFAGWRSAGGTVYPAGGEFTANAAATLTAQWTVNTYAVTFIVDGATYQTSVVDYNSAFAAPSTNPSKDGCTFAGWYTAATGGTEVTGNVTADTSVHAQWTIKTYTVSLPTGTGYTATADSGSASPVDYGGSYSFTVAISEHYDAANMQVYANGVLLTTASTGSPYSYTISNVAADTTVTVTGVTVETYTVSFLVDGTLQHSRQVAYNGTLIEPEHPTKAGYTFSAWKKAANTDGTGGLSAWTFGSDKVTADTTFVAEWTSVTYTVTLPGAQSGYYSVAASSENNMNSVAYNGDFEFTVTLESGAESVGSLVVYANGAQLSSTSTNGSAVTYKLTGVTENKVITISGVGLTTYSVVYYQNTSDYVSGMPAGDVKTHGTALTLSNNAPTRMGYAFSKWNTAADGGGTDYAAGAPYTDEANLTLYAVWTANSYNVTLNTDGGTVNSGDVTSYTYGTGATLPTDVTRSGYTFGGWYTKSNFEGNRVYNISATELGNKTFYAKWTQNPVTPKVKAGYSGVYDGAAHTLELDELDNWAVSSYQWYFKANGAEDFTAISGATAAAYDVTDVAQSGTYYCRLTGTYSNSGVSYPGAVTDTQPGTVTITARGVTLTAATDSKAYDGTPLTSSTATGSDYNIENSIGLVPGHTVTVMMDSDSTIKNVGTAANTISAYTIHDAGGADVTANYTVTTATGMLTVTKAAAPTVKGKTVSRTVNGPAPDISDFYEIGGVQTGDSLSLAGAAITSVKSGGNEVAGADVAAKLTSALKTSGSYTVTISYDGANGTNYEANYDTLSSGTVTGTLSVTNPPPAPSGGGGGGTAGGETVTAPVSGDKNTVNVTVSVTGTAATLRSADIEKALEGNVETGTVEIDVGGLKQDIASVTIPAKTVSEIAAAVAREDNATNALTLRLADGAVTLDAAAVEAIKEQAGGKDLRLNLNGVEVSAMNKTQQAATADLEIEVVLDVSMTSGSTRISDFKGGSAEIRLPFTAPDGRAAAEYRVWYVAEDGALTDQRARYDTSDNCFVFTVTHFSHYVVAYDKNRAACPQDETCPIAAFTDADPTAWYHDGVHYALENGIMTGYGNGLFGPGDSTSRAMMAQILWNLEGQPAVNEPLTFSDVAEDMWYAGAIRWAAAAGVMCGYGDDLFGPDDAMTREQLAAIVHRCALSKGADASAAADLSRYADADAVSAWALDAMRWAAAAGIVRGRTDTALAPLSGAARAEIAVIMMRYCAGM